MQENLHITCVTLFKSRKLSHHRYLYLCILPAFPILLVRESARKGSCERQGIYEQHGLLWNAPTRFRNKAKVSWFPPHYYRHICRIKMSMSPRLHKACIPSSSCKLLPPTADAVACDASKWTLPFLTSKEALAPSTAAWEGGRDCTLTWEEGCWPCWPSWRLRENTDWGTRYQEEEEK